MVYYAVIDTNVLISAIRFDILAWLLILPTTETAHQTVVFVYAVSPADCNVAKTFYVVDFAAFANCRLGYSRSYHTVPPFHSFSMYVSSEVGRISWFPWIHRNVGVTKVKDFLNRLSFHPP